MCLPGSPQAWRKNGEPGNRFEQSRLLAALIPNSRLVPLDSSNHLLPERDPAWKHFLAEVDRFLPGSR